MKVLLTGCGGRIGQEVLKYFIRKKFFVYANYNKKIIKNKFNKKFYTPLKINLFNKKIKLPNDINSIIHMASTTSNHEDKKTYKKNMKITKNLVNSIKQNSNIKKLIFFSSASIYSDKNFGSVNEKFYKKNQNYYARSKYKSEMIFRKLKKTKIYNLRLPGVLGTTDEKGFLSSVIFKMKKNLNIKLFNNQNKFNNVILIDSLNSFMLNLLKKNYNSGTILLGSSSPRLLGDIVNSLKKKT